MEVSRYVNLFYASCFIIAVVIFNKLVRQIWDAVEQLQDVSIVGNTITLTSVLAVVLAAGLTAYAFKREDYRAYVSEVVIELKKVTWPTFEQTKRSTFIVGAFTVVVSLYLFGMDTIWRYLTDLLLIHG
ncbi:MAG: preprotein translocase subunit SecE [bacterium]